MKEYSKEGAVFTLQHFCRENCFNFDYARHFISKLAELEKKKKVEIEKQIVNTLNIWNRFLPN